MSTVLASLSTVLASLSTVLASLSTVLASLSTVLASLSTVLALLIPGFLRFGVFWGRLSTVLASLSTVLASFEYGSGLLEYGSGFFEYGSGLFEYGSGLFEYGSGSPLPPLGRVGFSPKPGWWPPGGREPLTTLGCMRSVGASDLWYKALCLSTHVAVLDSVSCRVNRRSVVYELGLQAEWRKAGGCVGGWWVVGRHASGRAAHLHTHPPTRPPTPTSIASLLHLSRTSAAPPLHLSRTSIAPLLHLSRTSIGPLRGLSPQP